MVDLPRKPIYFGENRNLNFSIHELGKSLYSLVVSVSKSKGSLELSSLNFLANRPSENTIRKIVDISSKSILISDLIPKISNSARRGLLSSHVLAYYFEEFRNIKPIRSNNSEPRLIYEDVVSETAEIYKLLTNWGEPAAAMLLAKFENISVRTIQNRIRLAREKGLLTQPGAGKRLN